MDRPSLLVAILAIAALLASSPAVGSLRGLNEKGPVPPLPVDSKPSNRTAAGSAGLLASPAASNSSSPPPSPPHGSESKPPPVVKNNSSASPASRSPGSPASSSPQPPPTKHQSQVPSSERPQPKKPPRAKSSSSGAGSEAPPGGVGGGGRGGKPSAKEADNECAGGHHQQCPGKVIVCFWHPENGTEELFILVQNKGPAVAVVSSPLSVEPTPVRIAKNATKKIKLQSDAVPTSVVLNVGGKNCSLTSTSPVNVDNFFQQLPAYATPVYGAYAVLVTALVAGVTWACCKCRKKSRTADSGIPYQQLEMGVQASTSAVDANGDEGWYEGWDNDWEDDEETGSRTKGTQHESNVSANGIPVTLSRAPARDEWEDWDD